MNSPSEMLSRRAALSKVGILAGTALTGVAIDAPAAAPAPATPDPNHGFVLCMNTATLRGFKMSLVEEVELTAKTGYSAIEPWTDKMHRYAAEGGSLKDLGKRIADLGLIVESAIAFSQFIVNDDAVRAKAMEQARLDMDAVAQIGGRRIAAPPAGATKEPGLDLHKAAERYRALLELGDQMGVVPELELWGHSQNIRRLSEAAFVAIEARHPHACILADLFHLHKGGSGFEGLRLLSGDALPVVHMNDYPAIPLPDEIDDSFRVFPGDGVAPLTDILHALHDSGGHTVLSLELFNHLYWKRDPVTIARIGLEKMRTAVAKAFA